MVGTCKLRQTEGRLARLWTPLSLRLHTPLASVPSTGRDELTVHLQSPEFRPSGGRGQLPLALPPGNQLGDNRRGLFSRSVGAAAEDFYGHIKPQP